MSTILALIGYEVHAVCYSSYLSERDYNSFKPLFEFLGLQDHIYYGTFNQMSEIILQKQFDIRQKSVELIKSSYQLPGIDKDLQRRREANKSRKSILIIDEVDVFFSEHFYGKTFNPVAPYSCNEIREILKIVYEKANTYHQQKRLVEKNFYQELKELEVYKKLVGSHKNWEDILDFNLWLMVSAVKEFYEQEHQYKFNHETKQIGYKQADHTISYRVSYGYLTTYAYIKENIRGLISKEQLDEKLFIPIKCGYLSYAETPKEKYYERILGVTGTLRSLHDQMKKTLTDYNINN